MSRVSFVGGNWKCNGTKNSIEELTAALAVWKNKTGVDVVVSPPILYLDYVHTNLPKHFAVASQNCSSTGYGAYTGETSPDMLVDFGVKWTIIGHSERRKLYHESDEVVASKVAYALSSDMCVIVCIGEILEEREAGQTEEVVKRQLKAIADVVSDWPRVVIAYEPVWAIGTGVVATPQQAQEVHASLRAWLKENVDARVADSTRIITEAPSNLLSLRNYFHNRISMASWLAVPLWMQKRLC
eukprot:547544_1